jgi:DNA-binding XRE family transcriptional regulator
MTNITLNVSMPEDKVEAFINALNNYADVTVEDDEGTTSLEAALPDIFPGMTPEQIAGLMLKEVRTNKGLSQKELADQFNTSASAISAMENGKRPISKEMAKKFGHMFQVDYKAFL